MWDYQLNNKDITYQYNFMLKNPQGIENKGIQNDLRVSPNPTHDFVLIESDQLIGKKVEISISDTYGNFYQGFQSIITSNNPLKVSLENLNPGIYFIKLKSGEQFHVAKILKQ